MQRLKVSLVSLSFLIRYVNFEGKIFISGEDFNICEKKGKAVKKKKRFGGERPHMREREKTLSNRPENPTEPAKSTQPYH